jgi:hypothetical protein
MGGNKTLRAQSYMQTLNKVTMQTLNLHVSMPGRLLFQLRILSASQAPPASIAAASASPFTQLRRSLQTTPVLPARPARPDLLLAESGI